MAADKVKEFTDAETAAQALPRAIENGDIMLLKASRTVHLEIVAKAIHVSSPS